MNKYINIICNILINKYSIISTIFLNNKSKIYLMFNIKHLEQNKVIYEIKLKVHCVIFRMIYRQKCNIIYITTFSEEYKDLT